MSKSYHTPEKEAQHEFYIRIGEKLRIKRTFLNLTQEDVSWLTNVSRVSINNIESGKQRSPLHFIISLCTILEIKIGDIVPDYSAGVKTIDELIKHKALKSFNKICKHEAMEHIIAINGKEYYICPNCNYSKQIV